MMQQVLHQFWANAETPEESCVIHLMPRRYRTCDLPELLDLREKGPYNIQSNLGFLLKDIVRDVDETTEWEDLDTVMSEFGLGV